MEYFLAYEENSGNYKEISKAEIPHYNLILVLDKSKTLATLFVTDKIGMITERTAQRMADSITRSGYNHSEVGRIGQQFDFKVEKVDDIKEIVDDSPDSPTKEPNTVATEEISTQKPKVNFDHTFKTILVASGVDNSTLIDTLNTQISASPSQKADSNLVSQSDNNGSGTHIKFDIQEIIPIDQDPKDVKYRDVNEDKLYKDVKAAIFYYHPNNILSIYDILQVQEKVSKLNPDVVMSFVKCGEGDYDITETQFSSTNLVGYYQIEGEDDVSQDRLFTKIASKLLDEEIESGSATISSIVLDVKRDPNTKKLKQMGIIKSEKVKESKETGVSTTIPSHQVKPDPSPTRQYNYTFKINILPTHQNEQQIIETLLQAKLKGKPKLSTIGMEPYSRYERLEGEKLCFSLWLMSRKSRFKIMRNMFFRGSMGAMLYYDPKVESDLDYTKEVLNEILNESPNAKITIIKCGEGEHDIKSYDLDDNKIFGYYEIVDETDGTQLDILRDMGRSLLQERH